jgi:hypothetical protein
LAARTEGNAQIHSTRLELNSQERNLIGNFDIPSRQNRFYQFMPTPSRPLQAQSADCYSEQSELLSILLIPNNTERRLDNRTTKG